MGLERLSIVFKAEQHFRIRMAPDAYGMRTVRELEEAISSAVAEQNGDGGSAAVFFRIRNRFIAAGIPRRCVRPSTPLASILPRRDIRRMWRKVTADERRAPPLQLSKIDGAMLLTCGGLFVALLTAAIVVSQRTNIPLGASISVGALASAGIAYALWTKSSAFSARLPQGIVTMRDLVHQISRPSGVLGVLQLIIAEECAVEPHTITRETDLAHDLGI